MGRKAFDTPEESPSLKLHNGTSTGATRHIRRDVIVGNVETECLECKVEDDRNRTKQKMNEIYLHDLKLCSKD